MTDLTRGLMLMGYGLAGVFLVLILFYLAIIVLRKVFPDKNDSK